MTTKAIKLFSISTLLGLLALNDVAAQAPIHGCPEPAIPNVPDSEHNYNGDNAIGAVITYTCDKKATDPANDELTTTCGNDGIWTNPTSTGSAMACPADPEICLGPTPVIANSVDDSNVLASRPTIGSQVTYDCLANVSLKKGN